MTQHTTKKIKILKVVKSKYFKRQIPSVRLYAHLILTASQISRPVYKKNMSPGNITSSMLQLLLSNCLGYYTVSRWSGTVKLISIVLLYVNVTTINHAFNHSNLHLCCIYVANFIKIHRTVSKINVFKTWHLKCELSNIARASSLLPKSLSIYEHFTLQVTTGQCTGSCLLYTSPSPRD